MTSAPWWFVLVTAIVTGAFTLLGSWLTAWLTLRRQREELAHAQALEREKELYNRRVDFYAELVPLIDEVMNEAREEKPDLPLLSKRLEAVQQSHLRARVVSGKAVRALLDQFAWGMARVVDGDLDCVGEMVFAADHLLWELRIEVGVTTRDDHEEFEAREVYGPVD
ncbi:hypothetical protein [Amycolatopsis lurida]|uniref:hypothetical protein n=1 Tax=Amycolatopsis lurida TaxID=31959 RepID=UPI00364C8239